MASHGRTTYRFRQMAAALRRERRDCWICGQPINYDAERYDDDAFTVDHVQPLSLFPQLAEVYSNLAACHRRCNLARGNGDPPPSLGNAGPQW